MNIGVSKIVPVRETRKITGFDCVHNKKREPPVHISDAPNFGMHACFFLSLNGTSRHKTSHIYPLSSS